MFIAMVNTKGGVGKSTLAGHLAVWLHMQGRKVILVDCDAQGSSSRWIAEVEPEVRAVVLRSDDDVIEQCPALQQEADVLVADGPGGMDREINRALLLRCDMALIPCVPGAMDLWSTLESIRLVKQAQSIRRDAPDVMLVLNKIKAGTNLSRELQEVTATLDVQTAINTVGDRQVFADAVGQRSVVWRMGVKAKVAAEELDRLYTEIFPTRLKVVHGGRT